MSSPEGDRLEVGGTYLSAIARTTADGWVPLGPESFELTDGVVRPAQKPRVDSVGAALAGASSEEVARILAAAEPDPLAEKFADLDPEARWAAVSNERTSKRPGS